MNYCTIGQPMMHRYRALLKESTPLTLAQPVSQRPTFQLLELFHAHMTHCPACTDAFHYVEWGRTHTSRILAEG